MTAPVAEIIRGARARSGLSQRALAARAGTSGPTVAAYESGTREPLFSTVSRLVGAAGLELCVAASGGDAQRRRRQLRSLALAAATADAVARDPSAARALALQTISRMGDVVGDGNGRRWLNEWREVVAAGSARIRATLLDSSEHGDDMRQISPFAGLLGEATRHAVLAAADALVES